MYTKYDTCTMPCSYLSDPTFGSHNIHADNYWQSGSSRSNMQLINNQVDNIHSLPSRPCIQWGGVQLHPFAPPWLRPGAMPEHKEHEEPLAVSIPSHHWMKFAAHKGQSAGQDQENVWLVARMQHEVLTQRAAAPWRQVMMLQTTMRTGGPLNVF